MDDMKKEDQDESERIAELDLKDVTWGIKDSGFKTSRGVQISIPPSIFVSSGTNPSFITAISYGLINEQEGREYLNTRDFPTDEDISAFKSAGFSY